MRVCAHRITCWICSGLPRNTEFPSSGHIPITTDATSPSLSLSPPTADSRSLPNSLFKALPPTHPPFHHPLSDEIYASMTFSGWEMFSIGDLSERVPVIVVGGMAKEFAVPGGGG